MKFLVLPKFNKSLYFVVSGILAASLYLFDLSLELGVAGGVTYIILVLFSLWGGKRSYLIWAGITGTVLTWLGYVFSPAGGENWKVLVNRFLSMFVIWVALIICRSFQKSQETVRHNAIRLTNESRLKAILDNTVDGIITINMSGIIESFNPAAERLFGYSELEAIGQNVKFLMPEPWESEHDQYIQNYLQTGKAKIIGKGREVIGLRKNRTTFPLKLSVSKMEIEGQLMFSGIVHDISKRKEKEDQIIEAMQKAFASNKETEKAKQLAESANQAKGQFLAHMSHEIRTPLNAILGYSQILNQSHHLEPNQRKAVQTIETSGNGLLELINEVLDYSKIEAGTKELNPKDFDLKELLEGLLTMFENRCENKNLAVHLKGTDQAPIFVNGDEGKLRQVLVNLLGNAIKFTTTGEITLGLERKPDNLYKFQLIDTGPGIPQEDQAKIFEPFQQSESGLLKGGTGLGLSLSKELVNLMGGVLSLETQVGKGSCFFFTMELPPAKAPVPKRSKRENEGDWRLLKKGSIKALVVDDIEVNRRLLSDILQSAGIEIHEAENGKEAISQAEKFKPDIIFMDIRMPVMDGKEAAIEINKRFNSNPLKIVAITASVFNHEKKEDFSQIFDDYISKPFRIERIYQCMQSLLGVEFKREVKPLGNINQNLDKDTSSPQEIDYSQITIPVQLFFKFKDIIDEGDITLLKNELAQLCLLGENGKLLHKKLVPLAEKDEWEEFLTVLERVKIMGKGHD
jgi:PAS domain S-box-containing protein